MPVRYASLARVATLALLWGSGFFWIKLALRGLDPTQVLTARLTLGATVLILLVYASGQRLPTGRRTWLHLAGAAIFGNVIPYLLFALAERQVDSAVAGMLNATTPLWTLAIAFTAGHTQGLGTRQLGGMTLGLLGTILIFAPWNAGTQFTSLGALACLTAALSYGISYIYIARHLAGHGLPPLVLSAGQLAAASLLSLPLLAFAGGMHPPAWRPDALAAVTILGLLGTGAAYVINYRLISDDGPIAASVVIYLLPIVAITLGALILNEPLTSHALAGVAIVLTGVAATRRTPAPRQTATQPSTTPPR